MKKRRLEIVLVFSICWILIPCAFGQRVQSDRSFQTWDKNKDGKLTKDELPSALRPNFARVDADGDGFISPEEHVRLRRNNTGGKGQERWKNVDVLSDLAYADTDNPRQKLDLFLPKSPASEEPLPLIAFIHGGAWKGGDKRSGAERVARFANSGRFVAASIGYRLTGEAQWPAQIHDCKAAIRWLKGNAKKYNIDPDRICAFGPSAGGHLVAMLGVTGGVKELEGTLGSYSDQSSRVAAVVDFFGPTNFLTMNDFPGKMDHDAADSPESQLIGGAIQSHKDRAAAATPMMYVTEDDAPILILHGTKDPLVPFDQSVQFHKLLEKTNVDAVLVPVTNGGHGFGNGQINKRIDHFLQRSLLGGTNTVSDEPILP